MSADPFNSGILHQRLLQILHQHEVTTPSNVHYGSHFLDVFDLDSSPSDVRFNQIFDGIGREAERLVRAQNICRSMCQAFEDSETHLQRLDAAISALLDFDAIQCRSIYNQAAKLACQLLTRTSADVQPYSEVQRADPCVTIEDGFFINGKQPKDLKVCKFFDVNTMCIALVVTLNQARGGDRSWSGLSISSYIDLLAQLLRAALGMVPDHVYCTTVHLFLLKAFLWASWQRCVMLLRWSSLQFGGRIVWANTINLRVIEVQYLQELVAAPAAQRSHRYLLPKFMCPWALTNLQIHPATAGVNFDYFLSLYATHFGSLPARCILNPDGSYRQCAGDGPSGCHRFTGAVIRDQSAHRVGCTGACPRLFWNEDSYRSVQGARAVDIEQTTNRVIKYKTVSYATLAISHVWAHGQGGRPERPGPQVISTGFNLCLHQRYSDLARRLQCGSYWIDTACIPQDHKLRREAISQINRIFATSRVTVVCDLDLMAIDITNRTFSVLESVLVAFLVCDWNLRAWTLLEGVRGAAQNIHLLCKDDEIICLAEVISAVHGSGRLSLANLCLTIDHLISASASTRSKFGVKGWGFEEDGQSVEGAATMLRRRHASREGDEIVIWSLLCGKLAYTAEEFWRGFTGVRTGFLFSDAPRVTGVSGLSWAPSRPDVAPLLSRIQDTDTGMPDQLIEGTNTRLGNIGPQGLKADWRTFRLEHVTLFSFACICFGMALDFLLRRRYFAIFWKNRIRELWMEISYYWQILWLSPRVHRRIQDVAAHAQVPLSDLMFIQPSSSAYSYRWDLSVSGTSFAVIQSTGRGSWVWKNVLHFSRDDDVLTIPLREQRLVIE